MNTIERYSTFLILLPKIWCFISPVLFAVIFMVRLPRANGTRRNALAHFMVGFALLVGLSISAYYLELRPNAPDWKKGLPGYLAVSSPAAAILFGIWFNALLEYHLRRSVADCTMRECLRQMIPVWGGVCFWTLVAILMVDVAAGRRAYACDEIRYWLILEFGLTLSIIQLYSRVFRYCNRLGSKLRFPILFFSSIGAVCVIFGWLAGPVC